jgi:hypothetical protein
MVMILVEHSHPRGTCHRQHKPDGHRRRSHVRRSTTIQGCIGGLHDVVALGSAMRIPSPEAKVLGEVLALIAVVDITRGDDVSVGPTHHDSSPCVEAGRDVVVPRVQFKGVNTGGRASQTRSSCQRYRRLLLVFDVPTCCATTTRQMAN